MSLINDALKRAEAEKSQTKEPLAAFPLDGHSEGAAPSAGPPKRTGRNPRAIAALAAVVLAAGGLAAWKITASKSGGVPKSASAAAVAKPGAAAPALASAKPAPAKGSPATKPAGDATAALARSEIQEIIQKSLDAVKYYKPPEAGTAAATQAPQEGYEEAEDAWEEAESVPPASALQGKPAESAAPAAPETKAGLSAAPKSVAAAQPKPAPGAAAQAATPAPAAFDPLKYKVNGIIMGDDGGTAILNSRLVKVGDTVDGAKVLKITARGVHVEVGGQTFVLGS